MEFSQFTNWLLYGGGSIMAVSWILERSKWFQLMTSEMKEWVFFLFVASVSVGVYLFQNYVSPEVIALIEPFANILIATFATLFLGKTFHLVDRK